MGMYSSADLSYGIDLGEWDWSDPEDGQDHEELAWLTWELWTDSWELETASSKALEAIGITGVQLTNYGHPNSLRYALATKIIGCYGWGDTTTVGPDDLALTDDDDRLLRAWEHLFPGREHGEIAWRLSATFG